MPQDHRPLILHVVYRFDTGGLENGVVNLINEMDPQAYRHAVLALTEVTEFKQRVRRSDVQFIALHKRPGHGFWLYPQLYRLFRQLRPALVHTRNLAALEVSVPAWAAGVPARVHGEHGRDLSDLDGSSRRHQWMRRIYRPFVQRYIGLSRDLADYLRDKVGIATERISQIYNGVDTRRFYPAAGGRGAVDGSPFNGDPALLVIGTVGRMQAVKDQLTLARAFIALLQQRPDLRARLRLAIAGDGPQRLPVQQLLAQHGLAELAWLPGERKDIAAFLRGLDIFVLPSLAEGVSNTLLEAMASGLPVIATAVGGNPELVESGRSGWIVPVSDAAALQQRLQSLVDAPEQRRAMGAAALAAVEQRFALPVMVASYRQVYDQLLGREVRPQAHLIES